MLCKGCDQDKKLINAHIIPKSFYMDLRGEENHLNIVPSNAGDRQIRSNIGDYDQGILCKDCDTILEKYDDYGKKLLLDQASSFIQHEKDGKVLGWEIENYNYTYLKLFFLSILWRASISSRFYFRRVSLGKHEQQLKELIWSGKDDRNEVFGCVLSKFLPTNIDSVEKTILDPDNLNIDGINYYRLYLGGYNVWLRVDKRGAPESIRRLELVEGQNAIVVPRSFQDSKEFEVLKKAVNHQEQST